MDVLYFKTSNKVALFNELDIPDDFVGNIYESEDGWAMVWLGKLPAETVEAEAPDGTKYQKVVKWQPGEYFNIYLKGQDNMDHFVGISNATRLPDPRTPNSVLL